VAINIFTVFITFNVQTVPHKTTNTSMNPVVMYTETQNVSSCSSYFRGTEHDVGYLSTVVSGNICNAQIRKSNLIETICDSHCCPITTHNVSKPGSFSSSRHSKRIMGHTILD
jgi:hypothetical protein